MPRLTLRESDLEDAALEHLRGLGYTIIHGPDIEPEGKQVERELNDAVLADRLRAALARLNPHLPAGALQEAFRKVTLPQSPALLANNRAFHRMWVEGVEVEYLGPDGRVIGTRARLADFDQPSHNDWLAINQFSLVEGGRTRRPDIVIAINGLPLAVIELKNAVDPDATIWNAFNQLQTYKQQIPSLFVFNELLLISDGINARLGTLTSDKERFMPWRAIDDAGSPGDKPVTYGSMNQLEIMLRGVFEHRRLLDLTQHFIVFEDDGASVLKKLAGYHQFHAVRRAVAETVQAASQDGDRRIGVIWHTQGSGKSLTMAFYAGKVILQPAMHNPTLVVITDRNDLDDQLFGTFSRCNELLRQKPVQAKDRDDLRARLGNVASGGVIFTTIQKFMPPDGQRIGTALSERRNIVVIADEAHRSQYDFIDGFARHMRDALPHASFIGFTGTPIEQADKNTRAVFGDYISIYDIQRAVEDQATVPILYESRLVKLDLKADIKPWLDEAFDKVTEDAEQTAREDLKSKWAALEALVGDDTRIHQIAADIVTHFDQRLGAMDGKGMIVCMSRRICVALYNALVALRPEWASDDDATGAIKVVMTGSASDKLDWQPHIRSKLRREALAKRFKDPADPFKLVIVRDMWLTGFDAPCLHTMYLDKPMQGHGLMQAIARVNRVFRDKPGGLVVDYLGLAEPLRKALAEYTDSGGAGKPYEYIEQALAVLLEKYDICRGMLYGFDWQDWMSGTPQDRFSLLTEATERLLQQSNGKVRWLDVVSKLSAAFALAATHPRALELRDDVGFFQAVRAAVAKLEADGADGNPRGRDPDLLDHAIRQIVSQAIAPGEVIDIFAAAGLKKPDLSILSDEFLADVRKLPQRNLAAELLRKLLSDEIKLQGKTNLVQARSFADMLEQSIRRYQNRAIEAAQVIEEMIALAQEVKASQARGETLNMSPAEIAFYDALADNASAKQVLGDENLRTIAREVLETVRKNVTIDWTVKESVRAKLRVMIKRVLRHHGYPPDMQEKATQLILDQAEHIAADWA